MTVPNTFTAGTRIESAKVNENFEALDGRADTLDEQVAELQDSVAVGTVIAHGLTGETQGGPVDPNGARAIMNPATVTLPPDTSKVLLEASTVILEDGASAGINMVVTLSVSVDGGARQSLGASTLLATSASDYHGLAGAIDLDIGSGSHTIQLFIEMSNSPVRVHAPSQGLWKVTAQ